MDFPDAKTLVDRLPFLSQESEIERKYEKKIQKLHNVDTSNG